MTDRYAYQQRAVDAVRDHWAGGRRAVCLCAPTGAGKTRMAATLIESAPSVLCVAHRTDLAHQLIRTLRGRFGRASVGAILAGARPSPRARIQVASIQTLLGERRSIATKFTHAVIDECHHYRADEWGEVFRRYLDGAYVVGLTAYPQRRDGRGLGRRFEALVPAANYSELVASGVLVPARVYRPKRELGGDLAQDPVEAWCRLSEGAQTFAFVHRIDAARDLAARFRAAGIAADSLVCADAPDDRRARLEAFESGAIRVLVSVDALSEGIDIPVARCALLCAPYRFVGRFIQTCGRILRSFPEKADAIAIDLVGATIAHGLPTDDREYSLDGRPEDGVDGGPREPGQEEDGGPDEKDEGGPDGPDRAREPRVVDEELVLVARGALPPGASPKPLPETARIVKPVSLAMPRRHRGTPAAELFKDLPAKGGDAGAAGVGA